MKNIRHQGKIVEALLLFLRRLTPVAKWTLLVLLGIYAISGIRTIQPDENALVLRMGKLQPGVKESGLLWTFPSPFEEVLVFKTDKEFNLPLEVWTPRGEKRSSFVSQREATEQEKEDLAIEGGSGIKITKKLLGNSLNPIDDGYTVTGDHNVVQGSFVLRYRIANPFQFYSTGSSVEPTLSRLAYRSLTHELAVRTIDDSIVKDRERLSKACNRSIQIKADKLELGVTITALELKKLSPPNQVIMAFEDVVNARQDSKRLQEAGKSYYDRILTQTKGQVKAIKYRADSYANTMVAKASGEASAFDTFYAEYQKQPLLITDRLYWHTIHSVMQEVTSSAIIPSQQARPTIMVEPSPELYR